LAVFPHPLQPISPLTAGTTSNHPLPRNQPPSPFVNPIIVKSTQVRDFIKSIGNATLTDLLSPPWTTTERAFNTIDAKGNGTLSKNEWLAFITEARALRLKHYKVVWRVGFRWLALSV
jgi:hypothetical protein